MAQAQEGKGGAEMNLSQREQILVHLLTGASITPLEALSLCGSLRLSERIRELEREGFPITHTMREVGNKRVCSYQLAFV